MADYLRLFFYHKSRFEETGSEIFYLRNSGISNFEVPPSSLLRISCRVRSVPSSPSTCPKSSSADCFISEDAAGLASSPTEGVGGSSSFSSPSSKPVAITVIAISSYISSLTAAPKIRIHSLSACSSTIPAISLTSSIPRSYPPET